MKSSAAKKAGASARGTFPGLNIQYPISRLIVSGKKTVETRTYPIPEEYIGKEMVIIETPGKEGRFKARLIGIVVFGESFEYKSERDFYKDKRHCVTPDSVWKWEKGIAKWGWPIQTVYALPEELLAPKKRGIKYTKAITI